MTPREDIIDHIGSIAAGLLCLCLLIAAVAS